MPQRGTVRASRQVIVSWSLPPVAAEPRPAPLVVADGFLDFPLGAAIATSGVPEPPPVLPLPQRSLVCAEPHFPWGMLLAGSWITGAGCFEIQPPPVVHPGPRTKVQGASGERTSIQQEGRTEITGASSEATRIRSFPMPNTPYKKSFTQFDRRTGISDALVKADGKPVDLTGCSVCLIAQASTEAVGSGVYAINQCATIDGDPENGLVTYQWGQHDLDGAGLFYYWWKVTNALGYTEHFPADGRKRSFEVVLKP